MANIFKSKDGTWRIDMKINSKGKRIHIEKRGYPTEASARKDIRSVIDKAISKKNSIDESKKTFEHLMESYWEYASTQKRVSSLDKEKELFDNHINAFWFGKNLSTFFNEANLKSFRSQVSKLNVKAARKNRILSCFVIASKFGFVNRFLTAEQYRLAEACITPIKNDSFEIKAEKRAITQEQYSAFINTFSDGDRYKALFVLAFFLGLRCGELMGIQWSDYDPDKKDIYISKQLEYSKNDKLWRISPTKTKAGRRHLRLSDSIVSLLTQLNYAYKYSPDDFLFFKSPISKKPIVYQLHKHCLMAGIPVISPHEIRHTVASWLVGNCSDMGDLLEVSRWLGHSSVKMTIDVYGHYIKNKSHVFEALDFIGS